MSLATKIRILLIALCVIALEICCRFGFITKLTMVAPSQMVTGLIDILRKGESLPDIVTTFVGVVIAIVASVIIGFLGGVVLHALPRLRRSLDPFLATYYSIPILVFYPMFIVLFGVTETPKIIIGFLHAVVVMITSTLNGLDRIPKVLRKTGKIFGLNAAETTFLIILPAAAPNIFTGVKLAVAFAFAGVLGAEFVLSNHGLGYEISYAFNDFDNLRMYALILLVLIIVSVINGALTGLEKRFFVGRGR